MTPIIRILRGDPDDAELAALTAALLAVAATQKAERPVARPRATHRAHTAPNSWRTAS
jgi:hypothetical protein